MKKLLFLFVILCSNPCFSQELNAQVQINYQQVGGSNAQLYANMEKSLRDFINRTSWTGKKYENFEKIKCSFSLVITEKNGNNFKGSLVVQSLRPVFGTQYESPILNINDTNFSFEYLENQNLIFNDRQFSGKNFIDVISFYIYLILGYDADTFQLKGGTPWFDKAMRIAQNAQNQNYSGWSQIEGNRNRGALIANILAEQNNALRLFYYTYHRNGLDNLGKTEQLSAKQFIASELMKLNVYESSFRLNYAFAVFMDSKKEEIFNIFNSSNNGAVNMADLRQLMTTFAPNDQDSKWSKWK